MAFLATVYLPYLITQHQSPSRLFAAACAGNFSAIDELVRLDPMIIYAPAIQKHMLAATKTRPHDYHRIMNAATCHPYRKHSAWTIKSDLGGFLLATAKAIHFPLNKTDVVRLFDAYAQENLGKSEDADIPRNDQEAYRKQLYRRRNYWAKFLSASTKQMLDLVKEMASQIGTKEKP
jgi:hypothetical protein